MKTTLIGRINGCRLLLYHFEPTEINIKTLYITSLLAGVTLLLLIDAIRAL